LPDWCFRKHELDFRHHRSASRFVIRTRPLKSDVADQYHSSHERQDLKVSQTQALLRTASLTFDNGLLQFLIAFSCHRLGDPRSSSWFRLTLLSTTILIKHVGSSPEYRRPARPNDRVRRRRSSSDWCTGSNWYVHAVDIKHSVCVPAISVLHANDNGASCFPLGLLCSASNAPIAPHNT
jgi:hypothetical protein